MPRTVEITLPPTITNHILQQMTATPGIIGIRVYPRTSHHPPGDVIAVDVTNDQLRVLMEILDQEGLLDAPNITVSTAETASILSSQHSKQIITDGSQTTWEETLNTINQQSKMTTNNIITMFLSGIIAVLGFLSNTIHVVIGASLLAPGFAVVTRVSLGLVTKHPTWRHGLADIGKGYVSFFLGAAATAIIMQWAGKDLTVGINSYLFPGALMSHFTTFTTESMLISIFAAFIGSLLILANRTILTAGVMIVVTLVTSATIFALSLVAGDYSTAIQALGRWSAEVVIIAGAAWLVFTAKKLTTMKRRMKS